MKIAFLLLACLSWVSCKHGDHSQESFLSEDEKIAQDLKPGDIFRVVLTIDDASKVNSSLMYLSSLNGSGSVLVETMLTNLKDNTAEAVFEVPSYHKYTKAALRFELSNRAGDMVLIFPEQIFPDKAKSSNSFSSMQKLTNLVHEGGPVIFKYSSPILSGIKIDKVKPKVTKARLKKIGPKSLQLRFWVEDQSLVTAHFDISSTITMGNGKSKVIEVLRPTQLRCRMQGKKGSECYGVVTLPEKIAGKPSAKVMVFDAGGHEVTVKSGGISGFTMRWPTREARETDFVDDLKGTPATSNPQMGLPSFKVKSIIFMKATKAELDRYDDDWHKKFG